MRASAGPASGTPIVVALGGNALAGRGEPISAAIQRGNLAEAAVALAPLLARHTVTITHGNSPQVGLLLLESEAAITGTGRAVGARRGAAARRRGRDRDRRAAAAGCR